MEPYKAVEGLFRYIANTHQALANAQIPHAFGGAIANAYHGEPRATTDIDINIFLPESNHEGTLKALEQIGITIDWQRDSDIIKRDGQIRLQWPPTIVDLFFMTFDFLQAASNRIQV